MSIDLDKVKRETARWRILRVLDAGRPGSLDEHLILSALCGADVDMTATELRRELDYLHDRKLIGLDRPKGDVWRAHLNHYGVDVVQYTVDCLPGIARPPKL